MAHVPMGNPTNNVNDINMGSPTLINNPITVNQPTATMTQVAPEPVSNIVAPDPIADIQPKKTFMENLKNYKTEIIIALVIIAAVAIWYLKFRKK